MHFDHIRVLKEMNKYFIFMTKENIWSYAFFPSLCVRFKVLYVVIIDSVDISK